MMALWGCMSTAPQPVQPLAEATEEYRIGPGDVISIRVYGGEEELTYRVRVNDRSALVLPFGDFVALGKTVPELEGAIVSEVKGKYLAKPRVWVNIEEYRPYFVQGQVARPGQYAYQPYVNVQRAITIAGGFRERAAKDRIFLLRENSKSNTPVRVSPATSVRPGDTIIVEESFF
jgi:polysaccharide export outer membrane protein